MIVYKFISDCLDMINAEVQSTDVFDQVIDNPGTSVQPSWLAEDVKSSSSSMRVRKQYNSAAMHSRTDVCTLQLLPCIAASRL